MVSDEVVTVSVASAVGGGNNGHSDGESGGRQNVDINGAMAQPARTRDLGGSQSFIVLLFIGYFSFGMNFPGLLLLRIIVSMDVAYGQIWEKVNKPYCLGVVNERWPYESTGACPSIDMNSKASSLQLWFPLNFANGVFQALKCLLMGFLSVLMFDDH